jgi:hypothetical protein
MAFRLMYFFGADVLIVAMKCLTRKLSSHTPNFELRLKARIQNPRCQYDAGIGQILYLFGASGSFTLTMRHVHAWAVR